MNNFSDFLSKAFLAGAGAWILGVLGENLFELFWHDESEVLEVIFESFVGLVEPELVEIENAGLFGVEPDGVAFGFAEFATGNFVDNKRTRVTIGFVIFEALNKVDAAGAVTKLIGATELKIDVVFAEEVEEIIALDEGIAKFSVADAGATFADTFLDELTVEKLSHTEGFADFTEER